MVPASIVSKVARLPSKQRVPVRIWIDALLEEFKQGINTVKDLSNIIGYIFTCVMVIELARNEDNLLMILGGLIASCLVAFNWKFRETHPKIADGERK